MKKTVLAMMAIAMLATTSCKKEDKAMVASKENLAGSYKLTSAKVGTNGSPEMEFIQACQKDNISTLKSDMTFTVVEGSEVCSNSAEVSSNWDLPNSTTIVLDGDLYSIKSWNGKELVLAVTITDGGTTYNTTDIYVKQ